MHTIANRGGPQVTHPGTGASAPDWETVRTFLELVRCGSFRSAAERLGLSPNALRRKIDDPFPTKLLHTVRGIGFVLRHEREGE